MAKVKKKMPKKKTPKRVVSVRLNVSTHEMLKEIAKTNEITVSHIIEDCVNGWLSSGE